VTQDGMTVLDIPWKEIDAIFIGGTNEHKFSYDVSSIISVALAHNIWVHVGRVNSAKRMNHFWTADSWDGTTISYAPQQRGVAMGKAVREIRKRKGF
jgi:predicted nucleic acid binding AN1-type Zn finger protein